MTDAVLESTCHESRTRWFMLVEGKGEPKPGCPQYRSSQQIKRISPITRQAIWSQVPVQVGTTTLCMHQVFGFLLRINPLTRTLRCGIQAGNTGQQTAASAIRKTTHIHGGITSAKREVGQLLCVRQAMGIRDRTFGLQPVKKISI